MGSQNRITWPGALGVLGAFLEPAGPLLELCSLAPHWTLDPSARLFSPVVSIKVPYPLGSSRDIWRGSMALVRVNRVFQAQLKGTEERSKAKAEFMSAANAFIREEYVYICSDVGQC